MTTRIPASRPRRTGARWQHLLLAIGVTVAAVDVHAYALWQYGAGRADFQAAHRYDVNGVPWQAQFGNPTIYDFGNIGFSVSFLEGTGLDADQFEAAVVNAGDFWEQWANVRFGGVTLEVDTAMVKLGYDDAAKYNAATYMRTDVAELTSTDIIFRSVAAGNVPWTPENFQWTLTHELGHVLGLNDLYLSSSEEFVDHPVAGNDRPDLREIGCQDNVMDRVNTTRHGICSDGNVNDYSKPPTTIIDNDEIAALAWLWGSPYNQIVTGRLDDHWTENTRLVLPHHGDQDGGWWTYRGTIDTPGDEPCITIDFPGFQDYVMTTFPVVPVRFDGDLDGDGSQQVCIEASNWAGNFELRMKSSITNEGRVAAVLNFAQSAGRVDSFIATADPNGRTFTELGDTRAVWANLFGPVRIPEPAGLALLAAAWIAAGSRLRRRAVDRRRAPADHAGIR